MSIYSKIVVTILPLALFFLFATAGTTYYFSRTALTKLAETWLETRLSEAIEVAEDQYAMLKSYDLANVPASIAKAKMDAAQTIRSIEVGDLGYIFAVNSNGIITMHPDPDLMGTDYSAKTWFRKMADLNGRTVFTDLGGTNLALYRYFEPWDWYFIAADPEKEVYGVINRIAPFLAYLGLFGTFCLVVALMLLTRKLTEPLIYLTKGAEDIGRGELDTRIHLTTKDEFGRLAKVFNQMASRLQETLTAMRYREEHFRALIENSSDVITILNSEGTILYESPSLEKILGYPPDALTGKQIFDYFHPEDKARIIEDYENTIKTRSPFSAYEVRFLHNNGSWCDMECSSRNLLDHPAVRGFVVNSRDISKRKVAETELQKSHAELERRVDERTRELLESNTALKIEVGFRKEKEAELEKAHKAQSEFLANMSHELRTPLNSVIGFSELITSMVSDTRITGYLNAIKTAGTNLLTLINDILDLSKIEAGRLTIERVPVNIRKLFNEIEQVFEVKIREQSLILKQSISDDLPPNLLLDDIRIRQILLNLVGNAVKFTENGEVRLKARSMAKNNEGPFLDLFLTVEDTGIGIPEDKLDVIFESFQQESAGTARKYGGTGLGLSISKRLVELMGGRISVISSQGEGSVFEIVLPNVAIGESYPETKDIQKPKDPLPIRFLGQHVLIIERDDTIRRLLKEALSQNNLKVLEAGNIKQALVIAEGLQPDLILVENRTNDFDAQEIKETFKTVSGNDTIPILPLTVPIHLPVLLKDLASHLETDHVKDIADATSSSSLVEARPYAAILASPDVRELLSQRIGSRLRELEDGIKISVVKTIAADVSQLGTENAIEALVRFGTELDASADAFDIEKINRSLQLIT